ncbi:MAG: hypothetical protein ACI4RG_08180 [Huintestinicola sp.]
MKSHKVNTSSSASLYIPNDYINDSNLSFSCIGFFTFLINLSQTDNNFDWSYDNVVDYYSGHSSDSKIDTENYIKELETNGYLRIINQNIKPKIEFDGYKHTEWIE